MAKVNVRNDKHNVDIVYDNVETVISMFGMFSVFMANGESATFHHIDEEDGSTWYYNYCN